MVKRPEVEALLTANDVAQLFGVPVNTLKMWLYRREGPPWLKIGRHVRYRRAELERWLDRECGRQTA